MLLRICDITSMAIVILDPAQVLPFLATGAFPARWGKSTCTERVLPPGGGHVRKRGQTGEFVSYLGSNKKEKEKGKHLVRLH